MSLTTRQQEFQNFLLGRERTIIDRIRSSNKAAAETLMAVYAEGYWLRLIEVLAHNYPRLAKHLGSEAFATLARDYIAAHPSRSANARWYGEALADFLDGHGSSLADLARFEWALGCAFDSADPDQAPLSSACLATIAPEDWGDLRFDFHPSLTVLTLRQDAIALWQRLDDEAEGNADQAQSDPIPISWAIWRQELESYFRSLSEDEIAALSLAQQGKSFAEICQAMIAFSTDEEEAAGRAAQHLAQWFSDQLIVAVSLSSPSEEEATR